jgi:hypothetical protein
VGYRELPKDTLQRQVAVAVTAQSFRRASEDGERKEVVREHQCHTTRAADALMRMERPYVALAMCEWQKQQHSEIGMVALAHLRRDLQWS